MPPDAVPPVPPSAPPPWPPFASPLEPLHSVQVEPAAPPSALATLSPSRAAWPQPSAQTRSRQFAMGFMPYYFDPSLIFRPTISYTTAALAVVFVVPNGVITIHLRGREFRVRAVDADQAIARGAMAARLLRLG